MKRVKMTIEITEEIHNNLLELVKKQPLFKSPENLVEQTVVEFFTNLHDEKDEPQFDDDVPS